MQWEPADGTTGYNVYLGGDLFATESSGPACQSAGLQTTTWEIPTVPSLGELWEIEVTAQYPDGRAPWEWAACAGIARPHSPAATDVRRELSGGLGGISEVWDGAYFRRPHF